MALRAGCIDRERHIAVTVKAERIRASVNHIQLHRAFLGGSRLPVILQSEYTECGLACVAMIAGYYGFTIDIANLRRRWPSSARGASLANLIEVCEGLNLATRALRLEIAHLKHLKCPVILHWNMDHFVVMERTTRNGIQIVDPESGRRKVTFNEISKCFTGVALELVPATGFRKRRERTRLPLSEFFTGIKGLGGELSRIFLLSVVLEFFVLVMPLFGQFVIDEIVVSDERDLLHVLGVSFLLLVTIQLCISAVRGWMIVSLGTTLQFGWSARLFHHLIRLPLAFFERRHMGDILSRFQSLQHIENLVTNTVVEGLVDGMMAVGTLLVMFYYNITLTMIVIMAVAVYGVTRALICERVRVATRQALLSAAKADSIFMESVRAILPIKNFGRELARGEVWQNRKAQALNAQIRTSRYHLFENLIHTGVFAFENVIIFWIGALHVLGGDMSVGMLVAFVAYKNQFGTRSAALIDKGLEVRLVDVHLDRLADIALAEPETSTRNVEPTGCRISGAISTRDLYFRYSATDPYVLENLNLEIAAGECVAITGPSGFGKTTLVKLMMGLLEPTAGAVVIDGMDLNPGFLSDYRRQCAGVMQDDILLSGTLEENISLFASNPDRRWVEECARSAAIHEDILRMPMRYSTLVGDMGSTLSGGQRQRIFLARALYARPRILFLDEATSNLDPFTEHRIHQCLEGIEVTRIIVAHRRETLAIADRVIWLQNLDSPVSAKLDAGS